MSDANTAEPTSPAPTEHPPRPVAPPFRRSIVIPMFDEVERIGPTLELLARSPLLGPDTELILVDDGSTDGSAAFAEQLAESLQLAHTVVVRLPHNRGKGAAVRAGMVHATGSTRVFVDADLSVSIDDIERCFATIEAAAADLVYASRSHPASTLGHNQPLRRVLAGRTFNAVLRAFGLTAERDTQCGLKGFTDVAAKDLFGQLDTDGFAFDVEILVRAHRSGLRVLALPVEWDHVEKSRVQTLRHGTEMLRSAYAIRRRLGPAHAGARVHRAPAPPALRAMHELGAEHWWSIASRRVLVDALDDHGIQRGLVVDVGCAAGPTLAALRAHGHRPIGVDADPAMLARARRSVVQARLVRAEPSALPFPDSAADAVTAFDVLERTADDVRALRELARVVRPGGLVVVGVPAYAWAWTPHDDAIDRRRRYGRRRLESVALGAGLEVLRCTYVHAWLVPPVALFRRTPLHRVIGDGRDLASRGGRAQSAVFGTCARMERFLARRADLPFGMSVLLVARRADPSPA